MNTEEPLKGRGSIYRQLVAVYILPLSITAFVLLYIFPIWTYSENKPVLTQMFAPPSFAKNICYTSPSAYTASWRVEAFKEDLQIYDFSRNDEERLRANILFALIAEMLDFLNVPWVALGGTAVGTLRHASIIPFDADMDVGLFLNDIMAVVALLVRHRPPPTPQEIDRAHHRDIWKNWGSVLESIGQDQDAQWRNDLQAQKKIARFRKGLFLSSFILSHLKLIGTEGSSLDIDLFPMYWIRNYTSVFIPSNDIIFREQDFFPLHTRPFNHDYVLMPKLQKVVGSHTSFNRDAGRIYEHCGSYLCSDFQMYFPCVTRRKKLPLWQRMKLLEERSHRSAPQLQLERSKMTVGCLKRLDEEFFVRFGNNFIEPNTMVDLRLTGYNGNFSKLMSEHNSDNQNFHSSPEMENLLVLTDSSNPHDPWYEETVTVGPRIICQYIVKGGQYELSEVVQTKLFTASKSKAKFRAAL